MSSDIDGFGYESSCVVNVNWNADDRKWNVNAWDRDNNRWNAGNRVFSPETTKFSRRYLAGVFVSSPFFHPPIIRPSSCICSEMAAYFFVSSDLLSQSTRSSSFIASNFRIAIRR